MMCLRCTRSMILVMGLLPCFKRTGFSFCWSNYSQLSFFPGRPVLLLRMSKRMTWSTRSSIGGGPNLRKNSLFGRPRLIRALQDFGIQLSKRAREIRRNLPVKLLFFLVGIYCSTAFSTVIGQTGDWDILSAGFAVVLVEGIGALMYKASLPSVEIIKSLISIFNYWKIGLTLGLFFDAFKY